MYILPPDLYQTGHARHIIPYASYTSQSPWSISFVCLFLKMLLVPFLLLLVVVMVLYKKKTYMSIIISPMHSSLNPPLFFLSVFSSVSSIFLLCYYHTCNTPPLLAVGRPGASYPQSHSPTKAKSLFFFLSSLFACVSSSSTSTSFYY